MKNKITKSSTDKVVTGVCGGIAEHFGVSSLGVRLLFLFVPSGLLIYFILIFTIPDSQELL